MSTEDRIVTVECSHFTAEFCCNQGNLRLQHLNATDGQEKKGDKKEREANKIKKQEQERTQKHTRYNYTRHKMKNRADLKFQQEYLQ